MFRIGRFHEGKNRPIVIKLRSIWNRRILLNSANKLKNYGGRVFISAAEPLDERRRRILQRMKLRAEREGKSVSVNAGIPIVDDVRVFSLNSGRLISHTDG